MLHLTAGDVNAARLREAALPGDVVACIDALHEGPTPAGVDGGPWRELRAGYAASRRWATRDWAVARLTEADDALTRAKSEDEVVLWFEHDLHCQLTLVWLLDRLRRGSAGRVSLICIGAFTGVPAFHGLGDLSTPYMGDVIFYGYLDDLRHGPNPLVVEEAGSFSATPTGRDVLAARRDAIGLRGVDRWLGGVRVQSPAEPRQRAVWRWDAGERRIVRG